MNRANFFIAVLITGLLIIGFGTSSGASGKAAGTASPWAEWYENTIFWVWGAVTGDEEGIRSFLARVKPAAALIGSKHHPGFASYPTKVGIRMPGDASSGKRQKLWRKVTREMGVKLTFTQSGLLDTQAGIAHPEWIRKDPEGKPVSDRGVMCLNSGYVDSYFLPMVKEVMEWYQPNAWWFDGDNWAVRPCFCDNCIKKFKKEYGMPAPRSLNDPSMKKFMEFHRKDFVRYAKKTADLVHAIDPTCLYHTNWGWGFCHPEPVPEWIDYLSADIPTRHRPEEFDLLARYLSTSDKPYDVVSAELTQFGYPYPKPMDHLLLEETLTLMNGGRYSIWGSFNSLYKHNTLVHLRRFAENRRDIFMGTTSYPDAAILHSAGTFYAEGGGYMNFQMQALGRIFGAQKFLNEEHYHFDVMNETYAWKNLDKYRLVILPEQTCLDERTIHALRRFVDRGGTLVATGLTGTKKRPDGSLRFLLDDVFGVRFLEGDSIKPGYVGWENYHLPIQYAFQKIEPVTAKPAAPLYKSYNDQDDTVLETPAAVVNYCGKGKVLYIGADIFSQYFSAQHPAIRKFIANMVSLVAPERLISTNAPPQVEFSLRKKGSTLIVNVCNKTPGRNTRAGESPFIDKIQNMGPLTVTVLCPNKPAGVLLIPDDKPREELVWQWKNGAVQLQIPQIHIHSAIVLERAL